MFPYTEFNFNFIFLQNIKLLNSSLCRWTTSSMPHKIMQLLEQVALQWEEDEERFNKLQLSDLTAFNDRLDNLTVCLQLHLCIAAGCNDHLLFMLSKQFCHVGLNVGTTV